jgi:hypothetical protein
LLDLVESDTTHPLAYSSNISLPLNLAIVGLNQIIYCSTNLSILYQFFGVEISLAWAFHSFTPSLPLLEHFFHN